MKLGRWVKVESEFLSDALEHAMFCATGELSGKVPPYGKVKVHSFRQDSKRFMEIAWEMKYSNGDSTIVEFGNCKIDSLWWED